MPSIDEKVATVAHIFSVLCALDRPHINQCLVVVLERGVWEGKVLADVQHSIALTSTIRMGACCLSWLGPRIHTACLHLCQDDALPKSHYSLSYSHVFDSLSPTLVH